MEELVSAGTHWYERPVLVTGATGLLGSWLVEHLLRCRAAVVCVVRDMVPRSRLFREQMDQQVVIVRGDVCERSLIERTLHEYEIQTVFHLAAQTIVTVANKHPTATFTANIAGTWTVLEACRQTPTVTGIVVASSDKAYGAHDRPYDEATPLQGRHPYDVSKTCADLIAQSYFHSFSLPVCITRCANLFGGGDLNWSRLVPGTIAALHRHQQPVIRSDGQFVRDYLYVEDAALAYLHLAQRMSQDPALAGQAFNFANDQPLSVLEMVGHLIRLMGSAQSPRILNQAANEIREQRLDSQRARSVLGWKPRFSVDEGLTRTIAWYKAFLDSATARHETPAQAT